MFNPLKCPLVLYYFFKNKEITHISHTVNSHVLKIIMRFVHKEHKSVFVI